MANKSYSSNFHHELSKFLSLIGVLVITIALPVTVFFLQQQQEIRQHAQVSSCAGIEPRNYLSPHTTNGGNVPNREVADHYLRVDTDDGRNRPFGPIVEPNNSIRDILRTYLQNGTLTYYRFQTTRPFASSGIEAQVTSWYLNASSPAYAVGRQTTSNGWIATPPDEIMQALLAYVQDGSIVILGLCANDAPDVQPTLEPFDGGGLGGMTDEVGHVPPPPPPPAGCNPGQVANVSCFMGTSSNVLTWFVYLAGILMVIVVIYAGINFITSMGDAKKEQAARDILRYALIGAVVISFAYFIIYLIAGLTGVTDFLP